MIKSERSYLLLVILCSCLVLVNCSWLNRSESVPSPQPIDPFVSRYQTWQKLVELGNQSYQNQDLVLALEQYQQAVELRPDQYPPLLRIAQIYYQLQEYEKAKTFFHKYLDLNPRDRNACNYLGYVHEILQDYESAAEQFEASLRLYDQDLYALNHLGLAYKQLGRYKEAEDVLRQALLIDPHCQQSDNRNLHNYLALIYQETKQIGSAIAELRESIRLFPDDIWARTQVANLYEAAYRIYEAQLQYTEILRIEPDNLLAQSRLQALDQATPKKPLAIVSPVDLIEIDTQSIIENAPTAEDYPNDDAIILLNQFCHEITAEGKSRYTSHKIIKIFNQRGIQKHDDLAIPYNPNSQHITVNSARTILPNGTIVKPAEDAYNDVTPPGQLTFNLYSDGLWKVISMPALKAGVCIEYKVSLEDMVPSGADQWFWGSYTFQSTDPTLQTNYALRLYGDKQFRWKAVNCELDPEIMIEGETKTYLWHYGETHSIRESIGQSNTSELAAQFRFSSVNSWDAISAWYADLARDRYTSSQEIDELARDLTQSVNTSTEKIHQLYNFVASQIRYVSIQLGQGAYQPTAADQVLIKRYGDCKDKSTLLISLLASIGISAFPALMSPSPYDPIDLDLPSVGQFSHLIVAIPIAENGLNKRQNMDSDYLWLDPTASSCPFGTLPTSNQGRTALLVKNKTANFVKIPNSLPENNRLKIEADLLVQTDGSFNGKMSIQPIGQYGIDYRLTYRDIQVSSMDEAFSRELSRSFSGIMIKQHRVSDLRDLDQPVKIHLDFQADSMLQSIDNQHQLLYFDGADFVDYADIFASPERIYALDLSHPILVEKTTRIQLPTGWVPLKLPDGKDTHSDVFSSEQSFGQLNVEVTYNKTEIIIDLTLEVVNPIIAPEIYPVARTFFRSLIAKDQLVTTLKKVPVS